MNDSILSWALAALSYDEKNMPDHIAHFFPGCRFHLKYTENGSHFYGIVIDNNTGLARVFNRGTDAFNFVGKLQAWWTNLNHSTSGDGVYDGFQKTGDTVFNEFKKYLYDVDHAVFSGHSQGGLCSYVSCLAVENINLKTVHFDPFATPPIGDEMYAKRVQDHIDNKSITKKNPDCYFSGNNFVNSGDIIATKFLREPMWPFKAGVDVGTKIDLGKGIRQDVGKIDDLINHSPAVYNWMMLQKIAKVTLHLEDVKTLAEIGERIIN